jgi:hypothetical protein
MVLSYSYNVRLASSLCLKTNFQNAFSHLQGNFYATIISTDIDADILSFIFNPEMANFSQKRQGKQGGGTNGGMSKDETEKIFYISIYK